MPTPAERVASDAGLRAVLEVARSWGGVSPSVFGGRPLRTTYTYGPGGQLVSSVTEAAWTDEDRELAVALAEWEADRCPGCGRPLSETTAAANEEQYDIRLSARCHCCTALAIAKDSLQDRPHPTALMLSAELRPHPEGTT